MDQPILRAKHTRLALMGKDEIPIARTRLAELERKERSHDAYLEATQHMKEQAQHAEPGSPRFRSTHYAQGWRACLNEFSEAVIDAGRER